MVRSRAPHFGDVTARKNVHWRELPAASFSPACLTLILSALKRQAPHRDSDMELDINAPLSRLFGEAALTGQAFPTLFQVCRKGDFKSKPTHSRSNLRHSADTAGNGKSEEGAIDNAEI